MPEENENKAYVFEETPLNLPKGSVTSILALTVVSAFVIAAFVAPGESAALLKDAAFLALGFYFGVRK